MKFEKLYLHGFKSFVDKTTIDFPDGITAVVGPNGSGKSNIMDAVRWVFGEQNAKELRGADMDDIVFNGSQKRKPAGFAEVGLTLSDISEDIASKYGTFSDITISRKFYKTGEREYFINNSKCRLKDIKDIFMDTGLGARSISIIEQGKVEKIINATPEELRFFLEETAGVTKFKDKKKDAEKRLQQTTENLNRVNDILEEINSQKDTLSSQVEQLKIYEDFTSELHRLEQSHICTTYYLKANDENRIRILFNDKKKELEEKISIYTSIIKEEGNANAEYEDKQIEYERLQEERINISTKKTKKEGEIKALETRISSSDEIKSNIQENINIEEQTLEDLLNKIEDSTDNYDMASDSLEFITDQVDELNDEIDNLIDKKEELNNDFKRVDNEYLILTESITNKKNQLIRIESSLDHSKSSLNRLNSELEEISVNYTTLLNKKENIQNELDLLKNDFEEETEKLIKITETLNFYTSKFNEEKEKVSELNTEIKNHKNKLKFYNEELANSFSEEINELISNSKGFLIDHLYDIDKDKLLDIGDISIFDDSEEDTILSKVENLNHSFRFTFFKYINEISKNIEFINLKNDNVYFQNGIYKKIGSSDPSQKIISLKSKIEESEKALELDNYKLEEFSSLLEDTSEKLETSKEEEKEARAVYDSKKDKIAKKESTLSNITSEYEQFNRRKTTLEKEIENLNNFLIESNDKIKLLKEEINGSAERQQQYDESRNRLEEELDDIKSQIDDKKENLTELKIQQAQKRESVNSIKKELENLRNLKDSSRVKLDDLRKKLEKLLTVDEISWNESLNKLKIELEELNIKVLESENNVKNASTDLEEIRLNLEELKNKADNANNYIRTCDDESRKYELELAGILSVLDTTAINYKEKYGEPIQDNYLNYADKERDPRRIREDINRVESKIEELGAINLNALNDYNEIQERYGFLSSQKDDLEKSASEIMSFIDDTDRVTAEIFQETFNSVKEKFIEVFNILFGQGEAELRLIDPNDILNTGVEIFIQPPGKKLQHMGLLSGGEKTLSAMTLLFALFLQKPTPFCFLDEIDAPLDDANVERFVGMVKVLSEKTQFILITHNHNTMSIADSIYGVAMQEFGVSTILSVSLEQATKAGR